MKRFFLSLLLAGSLATAAAALTSNGLASSFELSSANVSSREGADERHHRFVWEGVSRVVAVGDLHGSYEKLVKLLQGADLVDDKLRWIGGQAHLVIAGDFLDRGPGDRPLMDLLRALQRQSVTDGGRVHVLLGNHEVLNLFRNTRYVNKVSYRHFSKEEKESDRIAGLHHYARGDLGGVSRSRGVLTAFNRKFPRGFFARQRAFDPSGKYGSWLLGLPVVVKINGTVYLHGGLREEFAALGVEGINREVAKQARRHLQARQLLEQEGIVTPLMRFHEMQDASMAALGHNWGGLDTEILEAMQDLVESAESAILGGRGPLWYRGNAWEDERIERASLERSLELLDAQALVVAHSPTRGGKITSRFQGLLYRLDHDILSNDRALALIAERGEVLVLDPTRRATSKPVSELPSGSSRAASRPFSDEETLRFLAQATVIEERFLGRGSTRPKLLVLEHGGLRRRAIFKTIRHESEHEFGDVWAAEHDRIQHEVAAYRLDRRIGLEMVPVTVLREIDGVLGSLQVWVEGAVDLEAVETYELIHYRTERAGDQLALAGVFDALIGNQDRKPDDVLCLPDRKSLRLIDHSRAFGTSSAVPAVSSVLTSSFADALRELDRESLADDLGDLISELQIEAVLARRDELVAALETLASEED